MRRALVAAAVLAVLLTGCTIDAGEPLDPIIGPGAVETTPTPTVEAPPVAGDVLTAVQARVMNRDLTGGFRAYKLADGTWVAVDSSVDLPDAVKADAVARIKAAPMLDGAGLPMELAKQVGTVTSSTGRSVIAVASFPMECGGTGVLSNDFWGVVGSQPIAGCFSKQEAAAFAAEQAAADSGNITVLIID